MTFVTEYTDMWNAIQSDIASVRVARGYPALNGPDGNHTGTMPVGREFDPFQLDAPAITIVPTGIIFDPSFRAGERDLGLGRVYVNGRALFAMWLQHEALIWGDPDPSGSNNTYDFSSAVELVRELCGAIVRNCGGIPCVKFGTATFDQPADVTKRGRRVVMSFSILAPVVDEPYVVLPFATKTTSGVTIDATIEEIFPDGSSTIAGVIQAPP